MPGLAGTNGGDDAAPPASCTGSEMNVGGLAHMGSSGPNSRKVTEPVRAGVPGPTGPPATATPDPIGVPSVALGEPAVVRTVGTTGSTAITDRPVAVPASSGASGSPVSVATAVTWPPGTPPRTSKVKAMVHVSETTGRRRTGRPEVKW